MKMSLKMFLCFGLMLAMSCLAIALAANRTDGMIHTEKRTLLAAAPLCAEHKGVFRIARMGDASYRLICEDGELIPIRIMVVRGKGAGNGKAFLVMASR